MARKVKQVRSLEEMMKSPEILAVLEGMAEQVMANASSDPNREYVDSLEIRTFDSPGKGTKVSPRTVYQVGAAPGIGMAVEAKRGTLARALGGASTT